MLAHPGRPRGRQVSLAARRSERPFASATDSAPSRPLCCANLHRIRAYRGAPSLLALEAPYFPHWRTRKDGSISTLLYVVLGWFALSLLTYLVVLPLLSVSQR